MLGITLMSLTTPPSKSSASQSLEPAEASQVVSERFSERRRASQGTARERRQFGDSHADLSDDARELALAIDGYKLRNRRRYITFEEMLTIIRQLGYHRDGKVG